MKAGLIGLGGMGVGMARNLAKAGYLAGVYNRTRSKAEALAAELNVQVYDSPQAMARQVDVVLMCVSADQDVLAVVNAIAETVRPASAIVDMSTVSSSTAQQAANILASQKADFLDAPVSGGVEGAKNATLAMMVGGDVGVLERIRPILAAMAARIEHMGAIGSGQACKAVNQIMCAGINQAVTEALAFAAAQGLDMEKVIAVISGGAAGNWFLERRGKTMTQGIFQPGFKLALHRKDLLICRDMAHQIGMACSLTEATINDYATLMQQNFGHEDISALYRLKRKQ